MTKYFEYVTIMAIYRFKAVKEGEMIMIIPVQIPGHTYDVVLMRGALEKVKELINLNRKVMIVTDNGVPEEYAKKVADQCKSPYITTIEQGEEHKNLASYEIVLTNMLKAGFSRKDAVIAVGGGICGDLAGFAAASYMRGIDFYNIPTTVLSQVDSSVGGKTAVNLAGIKNAIGAFYQPKKVIIDINVLKTLPKRQINAGLAESVKMAATFDEQLFKIFEEKDIEENLETIIEKSIRIKEMVVREDEKEAGLRKVLNFGHTIGHGIESRGLDGSYLHGECVAMGMLPMCSEDVKKRLIKIMEKLELKTEANVSLEAVVSAMTHDKKANAGVYTVIETEKVGTYKMRDIDMEELKKRAEMVVKGV